MTRQAATPDEELLRAAPDRHLQGPVTPTSDAACSLRPIPLGAAQITGGLWAARREVNGRVAVPFGAERLESAGNLDNLRIAAGATSGEPRGPVFMDSDVYKWLEAAAWEYAREPSEDLLDAQLRITAVVAQAQQADGYLNSVVQLREHGERYRHLVDSHEHYCAGHLFQAAVAQARCIGGRELLGVAIRFADHLVETFGDAGRHDLDGHPEVEMSLVELYRETGDRRYLDLARYFVETRGRGQMTSHFGPTYYCDRVPVREQRDVEGHAVRAVYLAAGAADVAMELGDEELLDALRQQHAAMEATKTYLTGGLGSRWEGESFGDPYELPPDRAYAETCAAIGGIQWEWRMLLATGDRAYGDAIERKLFNGFLSGVSLDAQDYFYVNPLQVRSDAHPDDTRNPANGRRPWFSVACCPPNIMRTLASLPGYLATTDADGLQVHQYTSCRLTAGVAGGEAAVAVETEYPWDGSIRVSVTDAPETEWTLSMRVPQWAEGATLRVNDDDAQAVAAGAYAAVRRRWGAGDAVELSLPMTVRFVEADDRIDAIRGCVGIERGPLVFAVEQVDQSEGAVVDDLAVDPTAPTTTEYRPDLLGGVTVITARGRAHHHVQQAWPYRPAGNTPTDDRDDGEDVPITAIPYFAWANRGPGPMRVWFPRC